MSAAIAMPTAPGRAPPRRPTGRALLRRVLKQPDADLRYWNLRLVPRSARMTLDAVADLVARSEHDGEWRPETDLEDIGPAGWLAVKMRAMGDEAAIAADLAALQRARLVVVSESGAVSLALPPPRAAQPGLEGFRRVGRSPGRPPTWMTEKEREEFKQRHRDMWQAQSRMDELLSRQQGRLGQGLMGIAGGRSDIGSDIPADMSADISADISSNKSDADISTGSETDIGLISASRLATAATSSLPHHVDISGRESAAAAAARDPREIKPGPADISADISGGISADISAGPKSPVTAVAAEIAAAAVAALGLTNTVAAGASTLVQRWMDAGAEAEVIRAVLAECPGMNERRRLAGERPIHTLKWFGERVAEAQASIGRGSGVVTHLAYDARGPAPSGSSRPRLRNPWAELERQMDEARGGAGTIEGAASVSG